MSAFIVNRDHITAMLRFGLAPSRSCGSVTWYDCDPDSIEYQSGQADAYWAELASHRHELRYTTADAVGQMLTDECVRSVSHRYPDTNDLPGTFVLTDAGEFGDWFEPYRYPPMQPGNRPTAVEVLKLISCYEYQSCEHPGWNSSEAKRFCDALRDWAINDLPGYDEADWEYRGPKALA